MDDSQKRLILIVVVIVAVFAAGFSVYRTLSANQLQTGVVHQGPAKSMKQMEMERQAKEDAAAKSGGMPVGGKESMERDVSGAPANPSGQPTGGNAGGGSTN